MSKHEIQQTCDPTKKRDFERRLAKHGITLKLCEGGNNKFWPYWQWEDPKSGMVMSSGFDLDIEKALGQLDRGIRLEFVDLFRVEQQAESARPVKPGNVNSTQGPWCTVCGLGGGLPCPRMVQDALKFGIKLVFKEGDVKLGPAHVHPGHCRKRLREWLDAAQAPAVKKVLDKYE